MSKTKKMLYIIPFFIVCFSMTNVSVYAADTLSKFYEITVSAKDISDNKVPKQYQNIQDNGFDYRAKNVQYTIEKKDTITKEYDINTSIPKELKQDGKEYVLEKTMPSEHKEERIETYSNYIEEPNIPKEKNFEINGYQYKGTLKDVTKTISTEYNVPFSIPAKFYGSQNTEIYILNGKEIAAYNAPEFRNYANELLAYLNLDGNIYNIQQGQWSSGYYTDNNGEIVRNAIFTGMQKSQIYTATYEIDASKNIATYVNNNDIKVRAKIDYIRNGLPLTAKVLIAFATIILSLMIAFIFIVLGKSKKRK